MSVALEDGAVSGVAAKLAAGVVGLCLLVALLGGGDATPSATATARIPAATLTLDRGAAVITCPGLTWTVLAAIGTIEPDNGQSALPGVPSGLNSAVVAAGPIQFEPATVAPYDEPVPPGEVATPDIHDPTHAVHAAAQMLFADGAASGANRRRHPGQSSPHRCTDPRSNSDLRSRIRWARDTRIRTRQTSEHDSAHSGAAM